MRAHIIGLAGSGKTTLACALGETYGIPAYDLDWIVYEKDSGKERTQREIDRRVDEIAQTGKWVTEGAYHNPWLEPLLAGADRHRLA